METKTVIKKRINWPRTIAFILIIYVIIYFAIYIYNAKVNHYEISGNKILTDSEILRELNLDDYPPYFSVSPSRLEKKLKTNPLISDVKISYKWNFNIKIDVVENKPLFIKKSNNRVVLADGREIENKSDYLGIPLLLNDTPDKILKRFTKNLAKVDDGIIYLINDIEYSPKYNDAGGIIDEDRFLLSMNDKNTVYVTSTKADALNYYLKIVAAYDNGKNGTLYLDSATDSNIFKFNE